MISPTGYPTSNLDPNMTRAIEELAHVINDVDQRMQLVKLGLVQSFPHLAASFGVNRPNFLTPTSLGQMPGSPIVLAPFFPGNPGWGTPTGPNPYLTPFTHGGLLGVPGVTTPYSGIAASYGQFRL